MSGRDLLKDSLARHRTRTKAEKRKNDSLQQERVRVKRSGNFFQNFGRNRGQNVTQPDEVVTVSNQESAGTASEITPSNGRFIKVCVQVYD